MSDIKYNAFISYKHAPLDNKIAKEIQTGLEHFSIPGKIRKQSGVKRFERIFRDLEELPITSDLNDNIAKALNNSDFLIVICSTNTKKSTWVIKEIEEFLKTHTKKQVFTVLADGEPEDVIPDILKYDTVTRKLSDGTEITREEIIEPLSCDYRMPVRHARRVELPRLAASMLGCSYDELMNRRRQYRIKRIAALSGVLAALLFLIIGYLSWSVIQIRTNLRNALINEAKYNSAIAENYLDSRDRVHAVQTALTALPSYEGERPVTSEALKALTDSLATYSMPGTWRYMDSWTYDMGERISKIDASVSVSSLAILDINGNLRVWDTVTHEPIGEIYGETISDIRVEDDKLFVLNNDTFRIYDLSDMDLLYENPYSEGSFGFGPKMVYSAGTERVVISDSSRLARIDIEDDDTEIIKLEEDVSVDGVYAISPDGRFCVVGTSDLDLVSTYYSIDLNSGAQRKLEVTEDLPDIQAATISRDGRITLVFGETTQSLSYANNDIGFVEAAKVTVETFDAEDGTLLWEDQVDVNYKSKEFFACQFSFKEADGSLSPCVVCMFTNMVRIYDPVSGDLKREIVLPDAFISPYSSGDSTMLFIIESGVVVNCDITEEDTIYNMDYGFQDNVSGSTIGAKDENGYYYLISDGSTKCVEYSPEFCDEDFTQFDSVPGDAYIMEAMVLGGNLYYTTAEDDRIKCVDIESDDESWALEIGDISFNNCSLYGVDSKTGMLVLMTNMVSGDTGFDEMEEEGLKALLIDVSTGEIEDCVRIEGHSSIPSDARLQVNAGNIYYLNYDAGNNTLNLIVYNIEEQESESIPIAEGRDYDRLNECTIIPSDDGNNVIITANNSIVGYFLITVDVSEAEASDIVHLEENVTVCPGPDSGEFFVIGRSSVSLAGMNGDLAEIASTEGRIAIGSEYNGDSLYVVYQSGELYRYNRDGDVLSVTSLDPGEFGIDDTVVFNFTDIGLVLHVGRYTNIVATTDYMDNSRPGDFGVRCSMAGCIGYSDTARRFVSYSGTTADVSLGYFDYKDVNKLIEDAHEYLGE